MNVNITTSVDGLYFYWIALFSESFPHTTRARNSTQIMWWTFGSTSNQFEMTNSNHDYQFPTHNCHFRIYFAFIIGGWYHYVMLKMSISLCIWNRVEVTSKYWNWGFATHLVAEVRATPEILNFFIIIMTILRY